MTQIAFFPHLMPSGNYYEFNNIEKYMFYVRVYHTGNLRFLELLPFYSYFG